MMTDKQLRQFIKYLTRQNIVLAPQRIAGELAMERVFDPKKVELSSELPLHSFKKILVPSQEALFDYENNKINSAVKSSGQVIFGLTVVDLKAVTFLDQIFAHDPYFQNRLKKALIIGHNLLSKSHPDYMGKFEEHTLEHLKFDIFLMVKGGKFDIYTGSEDGQRILDNFGYKGYEHIEYVGPIREEGPDAQMLEIREKFYVNNEIWQDLGKICVECGKCAEICPCCFCFDVFDRPGLKANAGQRCRAWTTCFYTDFSEVAGREIEKKKPKFLPTTAERIKFWYEHKFVRCPDKFFLAGCVKCGRCTKVCPVGIDIKENLQKILKCEIK